MKICIKTNDTRHHDNFHQVWCVVLRVVICVCAHDLHLLVGSCYCGLDPFHPGLSGATFVFCECHLLVICVITSCVFLWFWLIFSLVVPLSVHWFHTVSHPSWNKALIFYLWQVTVRKDVHKSCGYGKASVFIIYQSIIDCWSTISPQTCLHPPASHTHTHTHRIHLVKATNLCKFIQIL